MGPATRETGVGMFVKGGRGGGGLAGGGVSVGTAGRERTGAWD